MRTATYLVFDNVISGTVTTWYSAAEFNRLVGRADFFAVQTYVTNVSGTSPTLTVTSDMSADSQNWVATGVTEISAQAINSVPSASGSNNGQTSSYLAANVRFKITLGGTTPACRLKLYVTTRTVAT